MFVNEWMSYGCMNGSMDERIEERGLQGKTVLWKNYMHSRGLKNATFAIRTAIASYRASVRARNELG